MAEPAAGEVHAETVLRFTLAIVLVRHNRLNLDDIFKSAVLKHSKLHGKCYIVVSGL